MGKYGVLLSGLTEFKHEILLSRAAVMTGLTYIPFEIG